MDTDSNKKLISDAIRKFISDSDVKASVILGAGAAFWKAVSIASNVDFLIAITNDKFALVYDFLENQGWVILVAIGDFQLWY